MRNRIFHLTASFFIEEKKVETEQDEKVEAFLSLQIMMIETCYNAPLDQIPPDPLAEDPDPVYESLDEICSSQGSISNILGRAGKLPPKV